MRREVYSHTTMAGIVALVVAGIASSFTGPALRLLLRSGFATAAIMTICWLAYADESLDELRMRRILLLTSAFVSASLLVQ